MKEPRSLVQRAVARWGPLRDVVEAGYEAGETWAWDREAAVAPWKRLGRSLIDNTAAWTLTLGAVGYAFGYLLIYQYAGEIGVSTDELGFTAQELVVISYLSLAPFIQLLLMVATGFVVGCGLKPGRWTWSLFFMVIVAGVIAVGGVLLLSLLPGSLRPEDGIRVVPGLLLFGSLGFGLARAGHARALAALLAAVTLMASFGVAYERQEGGGRGLWETTLAPDVDWDADRSHLITFMLEPRLGELHLDGGEVLCAIRVADDLYLAASTDGRAISALSVSPELFELRFESEGGHRCEGGPAS